MAEVREKPERLRFAILCNSYEFERWQAECISETLQSGRAELVGLVMRCPASPAVQQGKWRKRWKSRKLALWRLYDRFYLRRFSQAIVRKDLRELLGEIPAIKDRPIKKGKFGEAVSEETLAFIASIKPDFILRFSYGILRGEILTAAQYGVWSFHHGDPAQFRGQPPGFWEIRHRSPVTGAILQMLSDELDAGRILHRGYFQTVPQSYAKSRDLLYTGVSSWVKRTCADIQLNDWPPTLPEGAQDFGQIYRQPKNLEVLAFLWITFLAFLRVQWTYKFHRQIWNCGIVEAPPAIVAGLAGDKDQRTALQNVIWMNPSKEEFFADPFGFPGTERHEAKVFFEHFDWSSERGHIGRSVFDGQTFGPVSEKLKLDTHLSYPYAMRLAGEELVLPENAEAGELNAYRMTDGGKIFDKRVVIKGEGWIDTTIIEHDDLLWAFALHENQAQNTHLHLYFAEKIAGPWQPHPLNPVKSDISSARPAGAPFRHGGRLYRPAQDCAKHYGSAISVNEVTVLSRTDYRERIVGRVTPPADSLYPYGLHTLSTAGRYTLIDGARKERRF